MRSRTVRPIKRRGQNKNTRGRNRQLEDTQPMPVIDPSKYMTGGSVRPMYSAEGGGAEKPGGEGALSVVGAGGAQKKAFQDRNERGDLQAEKQACGESAVF